MPRAGRVCGRWGLLNYVEEMEDKEKKLEEMRTYLFFCIWIITIFVGM
jgi:hypothetical protein